MIGIDSCRIAHFILHSFCFTDDCWQLCLVNILSESFWNFTKLELYDLLCPNLCSLLSGDEWKLCCYDKIYSWQIQVPCYSYQSFLLGMCKQNVWLFSSESSWCNKSIVWFYLKKENKDWKGYVKRINDSFQMES